MFSHICANYFDDMKFWRISGKYLFSRKCKCAAKRKKCCFFSHKFIFAKFSRKQKDLGDFRKYENAVVKRSPEKGRIFYAKVYIAYDLFSWTHCSVQWLAILNKLILGRGSGDNWNRLRLGYLSGKKDFKPIISTRGKLWLGPLYLNSLSKIRILNPWRNYERVV